MNGFETGQTGGTPGRRRPRRLSQLFSQLAADAKDRVTVASILDALGDRSFAALLVLFAVFNLIPLPPPSSAILGLPLLVVATQLTYGSKRAWLPKFMAEKSISAEQFRAVMSRVIPRLMQLERLIRPRYWPFWRRRGDRVIGVIAFALAVVIILPIPFGNALPAFSIALLGLSLSERDGILFALGSGAAVAAFGVVALVFGAALAAVKAVILWLF